MQSLVAFAVLIAACAAQVQYPAGVSPAACPNYPYCGDDANTLAALNLARLAPSGAPLAREYPAGLAPAACPNFPYCNNAVLPQYTGQYPAGVSAAACPGYPYC
ncbi:cuticle protein 1-like [Pollicipes pollicipes]|uniref:cuticle protein 1-like n=1 Tax=Pollicipes pollicipes TaxID=41117 RepID=UPI001885192F|nr:cuticle protein 1-like [Pollicipes pollicipes]XP_037093398.1 cuticle protein 1-like [Pollicipes pollicipes]